VDNVSGLSLPPIKTHRNKITEQKLRKMSINQSINQSNKQTKQYSHQGLPNELLYIS
jgi:hypothetical protein